jgi:hypothetical protein
VVQPEELRCADATFEALLGDDREPALFPLLWHPLSTCQGLKLHCNDIALGSHPVDDATDYERDLAMWNFVDISEQWLPFSEAKSVSEGGLYFPASCERTRSLLIRELERETVGANNLEMSYELQGDHCGANPCLDLNEASLNQASLILACTLTTHSLTVLDLNRSAPPYRPYRNAQTLSFLIKKCV